MVAWVLVISMGATSAFAVSGIASEQECKALHQKISATYTAGAPTMHCFSYQVATEPVRR
jgi:hypothetical protein